MVGRVGVARRLRLDGIGVAMLETEGAVFDDSEHIFGQRVGAAR